MDNSVSLLVVLFGDNFYYGNLIVEYISCVFI